MQDNSKKKSVNILEKFYFWLGFSKPKIAISFLIISIIFLVGLIYYSSTLVKLVNNQHNQLTMLSEEIRKDDRVFTVLHSKDIKVIKLEGLDINPAGYGKIYWSPQINSGVIEVSNLPPSAEGSNYQLWLLQNNKPVSACVFQVSKPDTISYFNIQNFNWDSISSVESFEVTMEPNGGSPQPSGPIYLLGNVPEQ